MHARIIAALLILALALSACSVPNRGEGVIDRTYRVDHVHRVAEIAALLPSDVAQRGQLRVGVYSGEPGAFHHDNRFIGYDLDLARALGKVLDLEVVFTELRPDQAPPTEIDIVMAAPTRDTPLPVAPRIAYLTVGTGIATLATTASFTVADGICGRHLGVIADSPEVADVAAMQAECPQNRSIRVSWFANPSALRAAITAHEVELIVAPSTLTQYSGTATGGLIVQFTGVRNSRAVGISVLRAAMTNAVHEAMQHLMDRGVWTGIGRLWGIGPSILTQAVVTP